MQWDRKLVMWLVAQTERFLLAILILIGAGYLFLRILFDGIAESEIIKVAIGGILTGTLIPITTAVVYFYFRRQSGVESSAGEP